MDFFQSLPLPAVIVLVALVVMYVMIARWESAYKTSHMGYTKDEWESFTARYGYSPKQIQNICNYYGWSYPECDDEWEPMAEELYLDLAEASMCHSSEDHEALCDFVIDGKGLGHWVRADTSTEVTPPRLGEPS